MIENVVYGLNFRNKTDITGPDIYDETRPFLTTNKDNISLYCGVEFTQIAMNHMKSFPHKKFTLVTHNSDHSAEEIDLPNNLVHWYTQNLNFKNERVSALPIGFENPFWHPWKEHIINNAPCCDRIPKAFAQFNPVTYKEERQLVLDLINDNKFTASVYNCLNGQNFEQYVYNMKKYTYCICPRGNGIDTHRIWEALYFKCIPIVKKHITHEFDFDLPIIFIDDWNDLTDQLIEEKHKEIIDNGSINNFHSGPTRMEYWMEKIFQ